MAAIGQMSTTIAHDMRSPLTVLKTYVDMKKSASLENDDEAELRGAAERSVGKLVRMADDLVDYSKACKIERSCANIGKILCETVLAETRKLADENNIKLDCRIDCSLSANVDGYKLGRVLVNLVNNAIQAMPESGGEVTINATMQTDSSLVVKISDNGKGIESENIPKIFDQFFTKGKKGGTGLGLAYCKQVVEAHGGTIDVESELHRGTTFTICIPNCVVRSGAVVAPSETLALRCSNPTFLIADDDPDIRAQWQRIVRNRGGSVVHTADSVEEVQSAKIDYSKLDAAIVDYDYGAGKKNGIDLIKHLKASGVKKVFLCTGFHEDERVQKEARSAGADSIIPKPIDVEVIARLL